MRLSYEELKIKFLNKMVYVNYNPKRSDWPEELQHVPVVVANIIQDNDPMSWRILVRRPHENKEILWSCLEEDISLVEEQQCKPIILYTIKCNACAKFGRFIGKCFLCSNTKCKTRKKFASLYSVKLPKQSKHNTEYIWISSKTINNYMDDYHFAGTIELV